MFHSHSNNRVIELRTIEVAFILKVISRLLQIHSNLTIIDVALSILIAI